jgi:hypothetical protein
MTAPPIKGCAPLKSLPRDAGHLAPITAKEGSGTVSRAWQEGDELSGAGDHCQVRHGAGGRAGGAAEHAAGNARPHALPLTIELAHRLRVVGHRPYRSAVRAL